MDWHQPLPDELQSVWELAWQRFAERDPEQQAKLQQQLDGNNNLVAQLRWAWSLSDFVAGTCLNFPTLLPELVASGDLHRAYDSGELAASFASAVAACEDEAQLLQVLRRRRQREQVRIIWRDLLRLADANQTMADATALADGAITAALEWHHRHLVAEMGAPIGHESGREQHLIVLAMGKLGGGELNVSSDIDLIFIYPENGETTGARRAFSNQEFFTRLGQRLIKALDQRTADGFVFRVDMRLRPWGESGALVCHLNALEQYYLTQGRDWERYAMIKARPLTGDAEDIDYLFQILRPFSYRRYLDYSAIESLRSMKGMINREVARKDMADDVKLGAGGIREIEFIVQALQLIRGGRDPRLQSRQLQPLLPLLEEHGYLPAGAGEQLAEAYRFLRDSEHVIQGLRDEQSQQLPHAALDQQRMALSMGFADWPAYLDALGTQRQRVRDYFAQVVAEAEERPDAAAAKLAPWVAAWEEQQPASWWREQHYDDPEAVHEALEKLRASRALRTMAGQGRERLHGLMPRLLAAVSKAEQPVATLQRILPLVETVARRSAYLLLLTENPGALKQLVRLCEASPWIADQLNQQPALLDELLDPQTLFTPPDRERIGNELQQSLLRLPWEDLEGQMDALRYFQRSHALRVAASEVTGALPLKKVSDYLTYLAEALLEHVLALAWHNLVARHGRPRRADGTPCDTDFIVVGYGKLGGIELGPGSDLDIVFIHDAPSGGSTDGEKELDNATFFARLAQRMIHILTAQMPSGTLYEIDVRLRPSGASGLLVSSLEAFERYQRNDAWTWEHQALVRARVVAGDKALAERFDQVRAAILGQQRDEPSLRAEVLKMRTKMREHLGSKPAERERQFHLKQDPGGIVDIEFLVQYLVLRFAHETPALLRWSDNIRVLETLDAEGIMSSADAEGLIEAYKTLRAARHRLTLQRLPGVVAADAFAEERATVRRLWQQWLDETDDADAPA